MELTALLTNHKALQRGYQKHLAGEGQEAAEIYAEILTADPLNADAWHLSGLLAWQQGRFRDAESLIRFATDLRPAESVYQANLAAVLLALDQPAEAAECCRRAIRTNNDNVDALVHLGTALRQLDDMDEALAVCRDAVQKRPDSAAALCNLGAVLTDLGQLQEAQQVLLQAASLADHLPQIHLNLGSVQRQLGMLDAAGISLSRAAALAPNMAEVASNRGNLLLEKGQPEQAISEYHRALTLNPDSVTALSGLGQGLQVIGRWEEATEAFRLATCRLKARFAALRSRSDPAQTAPEESSVRLLSRTGSFFVRNRIHSNLLYCASLTPGLSREDVASLHRHWGQQLESETPETIHRAGDNPDRRLKIGYVSPDFRRHATMKFFLPFFRQHDRELLELICYSENPRPDEITDLVRQHSDAWRTTCGLSDLRLAQQIEADRIDILVDLAGHTAGNRLPVFARRPAPVQASFLGYPNTTGLSRIDYLLTDLVREDEQSAQCFAEQLLAMPHGACCFEGGVDAPDVAPAPIARNRYLTLGSTHRLEKLSPACLQLWAAVLQAVPDARLLIVRDVLGSSDSLRRRLLQQLESAGVGPDRVDLSWDIPSCHLEIYSRMDVLLDVFPWPGGTTAYEAMWMGVPVPAIATSDCSRAGASFLHHCGLASLVAESTAEYIRIIADLAGRPDALVQLRHHLREQMSATVCNGRQFAQDLEHLYRCMWHRHCGQPEALSALPRILPAEGIVR